MWEEFQDVLQGVFPPTEDGLLLDIHSGTPLLPPQQLRRGKANVLEEKERDQAPTTWVASVLHYQAGQRLWGTLI